MPSTVLVVNDDHHLSSLLEQLLAGDPRLVVVGKARTPIAAAALAWEALPDAIVVEQHDERHRLVGRAGVAAPLLPRQLPGPAHRHLVATPAGVARQLADHVLPRSSSWADLADLLAPPVCEDYADEPLPVAQ